MGMGYTGELYCLSSLSQVVGMGYGGELYYLSLSQVVAITCCEISIH